MRGRGPVLIVIALAVVVLALDVMRPPASQLTTRAALAGIDLYQATVSKALAGAGARCRFSPTCSHYGEAVIRRCGVVKGGWMAVRRIFRCGPWTPMGTEDPPPGGGDPNASPAAPASQAPAEEVGEPPEQ